MPGAIVLLALSSLALEHNKVLTHLAFSSLGKQKIRGDRIYLSPLIYARRDSNARPSA